MPSGPESFVAHPLYAQEFTRARELLLANPGRWRVIYHYDGDGIGAASVLVRALRRLGYGFQTTALKGVDRSIILGKSTLRYSHSLLSKQSKRKQASWRWPS